MAILVNKDTKVCVQGITGRDGSFHSHRMAEYGTHIVGGTRPGKGGAEHEGFPVFDTVAEAKAAGANSSVIYVPVAGAADVMYEITPGVASVGIIPGRIAIPGRVGVVSRSGTLTYEVIHALTRLGIGQSTCVGIGGDQVPGMSFLDVLELFRDDPDTDLVVLIGEIGGSDEQIAAQYIARELGKPAVAFVAGQTAPPGKRMGHAGAIISGGEGTAAEKIAAFQAAGVPVGESPGQVAELVRARLRLPEGSGTA